MKLIKKGLMDDTTSSGKVVLAFLIVGIIYALIFIFFITETKIETIDRETVYVISETMRWITYIAIGMVAVMLIAYAFTYLSLIGRLEKIDFEKEGRKCIGYYALSSSSTNEFVAFYEIENRCPSCNTELGIEIPKFCPECGTKLKQAVEEDVSDS